MAGWEESWKIQQNRTGGTRSQRTLRLSKLEIFYVHFLLFNSQPCKFMYSGIAILKPLYYAFIQLSKCSFSSGTWYDIFSKLQLGCHPMAVVQYTFTHKQYKEWHKTNNTQNNTKIFGRARAMPRLCELYPGICLTTEEKAWKNLEHGNTYYQYVLKQTWYATNDKKLMARFIGCGEF